MKLTNRRDALRNIVSGAAFAVGSSILPKADSIFLVPLAKARGGDPEIRRLVGQLGHADFDVQRKAAQQLVQFGKRALPEAIRTLGSDNRKQRNLAAAVIGKIGVDDIQYRKILRMFLKGNPKQREGAVLALSHIADIKATAAVPGLIQYLKHNEERVRWNAARALSKIGTNEKQFKQILNMLIKGKTPEEREGAARALGFLGDLRALPALLDAALTDDSSAGQSACGIVFAHTYSLSQITDALKHPDPDVRESAAKALGVAVQDDILCASGTRMFSRFGKDVDSKLGHCEKRLFYHALTPLQKAIDDKSEDPKVRTAAYDALKSINSENAPRVFITH